MKIQGIIFDFNGTLFEDSKLHEQAWRDYSKLLRGTSFTDEEMHKRIKTDYHSPMKLRVNGQLPHNQAWYDAFGIKPGDKMYLPENKRADIW